MIKFCLKSFFITRIIYISFILIIYNFSIVEKYDLSTDIISERDENMRLLEKILLKFLSYFSSYDAIHFLTISKYSYINDSIYAFFPLFPSLISGLKSFISPFFKFTKNEMTVYLISGFFFSNIFCLINSILLFCIIFNLTNSVLKSKISVILFLINPGTIFYISIYSENICLTLQLLFIQILLTSNNETTNFIQIACLIIGLLMTRSNSIIFCSFFIIPCLCELLGKIKLNEKFSDNDFLYNIKSFFKLFQKNFRFIGLYIILCFHAYLCFIGMTKYKPKTEICFYIRRKINENLTKYNLFNLFCHNSKFNTINNFYSYLQDEYWKVGFLKQYSFNTLDRLILALPMNICVFYVIYKRFIYFDFYSLITKFNVAKFLLKNKTYHKHDKEGNHNELENIKLNSFILSSLVNLIVLVFVLVFIAHPQINNRLISGCPIIYLILSEDIIYFIKDKSIKGFLIILCFVTFSLLSCLMQVGCYGFA